jgi:hypothetical protein
MLPIHLLYIYKPFSFSAMTGDLPRLRYLLEKGRNPNEEDKSGYTALHYAARCGYTAACALLLEAGANINATTRAGNSTALQRAALAGDYFFFPLFGRLKPALTCHSHLHFYLDVN